MPRGSFDADQKCKSLDMLIPLRTEHRPGMSPGRVGSHGDGLDARDSWTSTPATHSITRPPGPGEKSSTASEIR
ncbi:hypothetical protein MTP99_001032 [Tenebrio molitor]|jgi:hypothetical protein|nr:hypothetical protein MTP99_001032 [Tenebrio molitor]